MSANNSPGNEGQLSPNTVRSRRFSRFSTPTMPELPSIEEEKHLDSWNVLKEKLMSLNEKNYISSSEQILVILKDIIESKAEHSSPAVLYIICERALRSLLTKTFPVSANIIDGLATSCSQKLFEKIQIFIQKSLSALQQKLKLAEVITGTDIAVVFLLLSMHRHQDTAPVGNVIAQLVRDTRSYLEAVRLNDKYISDVLMIYLYALVWYTLNCQSEGQENVALMKYVRRMFLLKGNLLTPLGRVLAVDIIEQMFQKDRIVDLYLAVYKKILASKDTFLLRDVRAFLAKHECPVELVDTTAESGDSQIDEVFQTFNRSLSHSSDRSEQNSPVDNFNVSSAATEKTRFSWSMCVEDSEKKTDEIIEIPEKFVSTVRGYDSVILRGIERKSGAVIKIRKTAVPSRPDTTSLTAHKLITGALGLKPNKPLVEDEKQKLSEAKVKRQTCEIEQEEKELTRQVKIVGSESVISKAKELIADLISRSVTISVPFNLSVDEILVYSQKLKSIELLLNVYFEIEEQEDDSAVLNISGELTCCQDANKLVIEEVGTFKTENGDLFAVPPEIMKVCGGVDGLRLLVNTVQRVTRAKVTVLKGPQALFFVFVGGSSQQANHALLIFQKTNIELINCYTNKPNHVKELEFTVQDLLDYINKRFASAQAVKVPSLLSKYVDLTEEENARPPSIEVRQVKYTRRELLSLARTKIATTFPDILRDRDDVKDFINFTLPWRRQDDVNGTEQEQRTDITETTTTTETFKSNISQTLKTRTSTASLFRTQSSTTTATCSTTKTFATTFSTCSFSMRKDSTTTTTTSTAFGTMARSFSTSNLSLCSDRKFSSLRSINRQHIRKLSQRRTFSQSSGECVSLPNSLSASQEDVFYSCDDRPMISRCSSRSSLHSTMSEQREDRHRDFSGMSSKRRKRSTDSSGFVAAPRPKDKQLAMPVANRVICNWLTAIPCRSRLKQQQKGKTNATATRNIPSKSEVTAVSVPSQYTDVNASTSTTQTSKVNTDTSVTSATKVRSTLHQSTTPAIDSMSRSQRLANYFRKNGSPQRVSSALASAFIAPDREEQVNRTPVAKTENVVANVNNNLKLKSNNAESCSELVTKTEDVIKDKNNNAVACPQSPANIEIPASSFVATENSTMKSVPSDYVTRSRRLRNYFNLHNLVRRRNEPSSPSRDSVVKSDEESKDVGSVFDASRNTNENCTVNTIEENHTETGDVTKSTVCRSEDKDSSTDTTETSSAVTGLIDFKSPVCSPTRETLWVRYRCRKGGYGYGGIVTETENIVSEAGIIVSEGESGTTETDSVVTETESIITELTSVATSCRPENSSSCQPDEGYSNVDWSSAESVAESCLSTMAESCLSITSSSEVAGSAAMMQPNQVMTMQPFSYHQPSYLVQPLYFMPQTIQQDNRVIMPAPSTKILSTAIVTDTRTNKSYAVDHFFDHPQHQQSPSNTTVMLPNERQLFFNRPQNLHSVFSHTPSNTMKLIYQSWQSPLQQEPTPYYSSVYHHHQPTTLVYNNALPPVSNTAAFSEANSNNSPTS